MNKISIELADALFKNNIELRVALYEVLAADMSLRWNMSRPRNNTNVIKAIERVKAAKKAARALLKKGI